MKYRRLKLCIFAGHSLLPVLLFLNSWNTISGQELIAAPFQDEGKYLMKVKQFNEFADRFNYITDFRGNPVDSTFITKMPRENYLAYLFDLEDKRIDRNSESFSHEYAGNISLFISQVTSNNLLISKHSPGIIAEARSRVTYKGRSFEISVFLTQVTDDKGTVKWAVNGVREDELHFFSTDTANLRFIPPGSNETDFLNLKRALRDTGYTHYYAVEGFKPDIASVFFYCLNEGIIRFEYVEEVIYHILDIPGWSVKVREFRRNEYNSGWLVSDLAVNNLTREKYLITLMRPGGD